MDSLTTQLIKSCGDAIEAPLTHIFNLSWVQCIFPDIWKATRVTPLYKNGAHDNCSNYRPISVLPIMSKMLERLVHEQLYSYVNDNNMLSKCQDGFRKTNCTGTCLIEFLNEIYHNMDEGRLTGVLFLDLHIAFDTMDHEVAICKLSEYNLSPQTLLWFDDYLYDRKQVTKVNGVESEMKDVVCGIPQESILGPLSNIIRSTAPPGGERQH